jgi:hypothetical protein
VFLRHGRDVCRSGCGKRPWVEVGRGNIHLVFDLLLNRRNGSTLVARTAVFQSVTYRLFHTPRRNSSFFYGGIREEDRLT